MKLPTRSECIRGPRPCPHRTCRMHLGDGAESCAQDVADRGPHTPAEVALIMRVSRERVNQIELRAKRKLSRSRRAEELARQAGEQQARRNRQVIPDAGATFGDAQEVRRGVDAHAARVAQEAAE